MKNEKIFNKRLLCRLGIHKYVSGLDVTNENGDSLNIKMCRYCAKMK